MPVTPMAPIPPPNPSRAASSNTGAFSAAARGLSSSSLPGRHRRLPRYPPSNPDLPGPHVARNPRPQSELPQHQGIQPSNEGGVSVDTTDIQTQIKILQSDSLIDRVVAKMKSDLKIDPGDAPPATRSAPGANSSTYPIPSPPAHAIKPSPTPRGTTKSAPPARPVSSKLPSTP